MPYKFETIGFKVGRDRDKRYKLSDYEIQQIKELYGKISQRKLAKYFKVSRRLIQYHGDTHINKRIKELSKDNYKLYYNKYKHKDYMKRHRDYKKLLFNS
jgi:hypothetical protein